MRPPRHAHHKRHFHGPSPEPRQQIIHRLLPGIEKPAEWVRRLIDWRRRMKEHLILLPPMIVILMTKVKVIIKIVIKKR
jgi:hypothetical protein